MTKRDYQGIQNYRQRLIDKALSQAAYCQNLANRLGPDSSQYKTMKILEQENIQDAIGFASA